MKIFKIRRIALLTMGIFGGIIINGFRLGFKQTHQITLSKEEIQNYDTKIESEIIRELIKKPYSREENVQLMNDNFDFIIIGGGSVGSGVFKKAVEKGLKICLIEKSDFSSGTSSRSTKIAHGGIRYLEEAFKLKSPIEKLYLVYEALMERDRILNSGAFINNIVEIAIPCKSFSNMVYMYLGTFVYQMMYVFSYTNRREFKKYPWYHFFEKINDILIPFPRIKTDSLLNSSLSVNMYEGNMVDSRQNVLTLLASQNNNTNNSRICNYVEFKEYILNSDKKIIGVLCNDLINNKEIKIYGKFVCNCTGIFGDQNLGDNNKKEDKLLIASKGTHIVLKRDVFNSIIKKNDIGTMIPKTTDGRILFILPYFNNILVGTTDQIHNKSYINEIECEELDFIIDELNTYFNIPKEDLYKNLLSSWSGLRPILVNDPNSNHMNNSDLKTVKEVSRKHVIYHDKENNLYSIFGGKWTTYLRMGDDLVNEILYNNPELGYKITGEDKLFKLRGSIPTDSLNFYKEKLYFKTIFKDKLTKEFPDIPLKYIEYLIFMYGIHAKTILNNGKLNNTNSSVSSKEFILKSELDYAIFREYCEYPNDFICRRSSLAFHDLQKAKNVIEDINSYFALKKNWSKEKEHTICELSKENLQYML